MTGKQLKVKDAIDKISQVEKDVSCLEDKFNRAFPKPKPWYTSFGVWIALLLTLFVIYLCYVSYMAYTGHNIVLPRWLR